MTALDHKHSTTDIANYDWTYDWMNRVTQFTSPDGTSDYTYDKESQLTATDHSFQTDESYTYDATGNRTNGSYSVGTNNRMTSDGTYNYTDDDEGNRLTRTKISDSSLTEYTWDHRNRLTKVVERAAGAGQPITKQTDYKYDIFDRRISKSVDADGAGGGSAVISRFVYDGDHIALQFDGASTLTHRYLHGPAIDQVLADEDASNNILWPLTDNLGTVRDLVDDSGAVQNHLKYDAFGKVTAESNAAVDHLFAYTGRERDQETGLQYHRARYYDPATGRFISHDPIGFAAGDPHLARYVGNSVPNFNDPTGLDVNTMIGSPSAVLDGAYATSQAYIDYMEAAADSAYGSGVPSGGSEPVNSLDYAISYQMLAMSPLLGFAMLANGVTNEDILLMLQHPEETDRGAKTGMDDGSWMVLNSLTLHSTSLDDYVDARIEEQGGTYETASSFADASAIAICAVAVADISFVYLAAPLYHYTTAAGASGIANDGRINAPVWATNIPPSIMLNPYTGPIAQTFIGWLGPWQVNMTSMGAVSARYMPLTHYYAVASTTFSPSLIKIFQFISQQPVTPISP